MNTHLHPVVLEARFAQLATALMSGDGVPGAALDAVGEQARAALRGVGAAADQQDNALLGRAAVRLARGLLAVGRGTVAPEQGILRLGVEMQQRLDPLEVAATVRSVRDGSGLWPTLGASSVDPAAAQARLFAQIALVLLLTRGRSA